MPRRLFDEDPIALAEVFKDFDKDIDPLDPGALAQHATKILIGRLSRGLLEYRKRLDAGIKP